MINQYKYNPFEEATDDEIISLIADIRNRLIKQRENRAKEENVNEESKALSDIHVSGKHPT